MKILFNLFFAFIFVFHHSVWAATPLPIASAGMLKEFVTKYNELSSAEKMVMVKKLIAQRSKADQDYFNKHISALEKTTWPTLKLNGNTVEFKVEGHDVELTNFTYKSVEVNGKEIDFATRSYSQIVNDLQGTIQAQFSILDILIPTAFAIDILVFIIIMTILSIGGSLLAEYFKSKKTPKGYSVEHYMKLLKECNELKFNLAKLEGASSEQSLSPSMISSLKSVNDILGKVSSSDEKCQPGAACEMEKEFQACVKENSKTIEKLSQSKKSGAVNTSSQIKDIQVEKGSSGQKQNKARGQ